ncbi:RHS domain-containing protein [Noviherbaspirillum sp. CPCC 100848]|uniref:RHS domain-containing protein n=1 Tax=Noviherbaspirillum album TaxID=3080276 RepID=A0ABU6JIN4_9BURK|nr:RHS domain-containing protein [Noviherbaspirillum sp. CPCC 100848]MEC4723115.1 RHS domain-containing protein [Noviherbaspirillum sp. CPCC 100848]
MPLAQVNRTCAQDGEAEQSAKKAQVFHIHTDHLGTPREMTDEQGQLHWSTTYQAWGNVLRVEEPVPIEQDEAFHRLSRFCLLHVIP